MARRRNQLADKLTGGQTPARPGWRDTITPAQTPSQPESQPEVESTSSLKRKTYLLTDELIERVEDLAERERVGINELVRFLMDTSLELAESNQLEIPTRPGKRRITY